jgi:dihydrofolate reductase
MIGLIAAVSANGVIGITDENGKGKLPWDYPADMKYFKTTTANSIIIFGRKTFESIGRALPKRRNIVISSKPVDVAGVETFPSVKSAMEQFDKEYEESKIIFESPDMDMLVVRQNIWFAGGARIYEEGMQYAEEIHLTVTPDVITQADAVRFPWINPRKFEIKEWRQLTPGDDTLRLYIYKKI